jgi:hypothetical protein
MIPLFSAVKLCLFGVSGCSLTISVSGGRGDRGLRRSLMAFGKVFNLNVGLHITTEHFKKKIIYSVCELGSCCRLFFESNRVFPCSYLSSSLSRKRASSFHSESLPLYCARIPRASFSFVVFTGQNCPNCPTTINLPTFTLRMILKVFE